MKKIAVSELAAGQRFSHPVYMDEDNLFVPEGLPIKERDIERLHKWGIHEVYSDGEPISEDPQQAFNAFFLKAFTSPAQKAITNQYFSMGLFNGLAIVAIAIIFDRVSQAYGHRIQKHRGVGH